MKKSDIIKLAMAAHKDKVQREILENFEKEYNSLLLAEADARRLIMANNIANMARLKMALIKFESTYFKIKSSSGSIEAIDEYISEIKCTINVISYHKNKSIR